MPGDERLVNLLGAVALGISDQTRAAAEAAAGESAAAPAALVLLLQSLDGASMDTLRQAVGLTPSGAVRLVDRLAARGLVQRAAADDRRALTLTLTPSGRDAANEVIRARSAAIDSLISVLAPADRECLTSLAEQLVAALTTSRLDARRAGAVPAGGWLCRLCDLEACGRPDGRCPAQSTAASG